ncbi:hypothetical protein [Aquimarina sp. RZ0]|uniref:hypothetical protein n=1 Tax=Aquimarina sp. RZ0 TaxID=2607730 RepID=UPI0011F23178|nr:hypothetical protein [Aquimarina sp. RZ0]KAA1241023.1 hypothetical protein F0000_26740 [Aquimarina sp. RZ0]
MKKEHQKIIDHISTYLNENPEQRFGQAIFNLKINEFIEEENLINPKYQLRDIHNDSDEKILERIESQLKWFNKQKESL